MRNGICVSIDERVFFLYKVTNPTDFIKKICFLFLRKTKCKEIEDCFQILIDNDDTILFDLVFIVFFEITTFMETIHLFSLSKNKTFD